MKGFQLHTELFCRHMRAIYCVPYVSVKGILGYQTCEMTTFTRMFASVNLAYGRGLESSGTLTSVGQVMKPQL